MDKNIEELITEIDKAVRKLVKPSRYDHSVRTAETAQLLCERYGLDERLGYLAGLAHDICKEMDEKKLLSLAKQDGEEISRLENDKPKVLHGRAAAIYLQQEFGIDNQDVIEAVRYHVTGSPTMGMLAKVLYTADKIEPGRPQIESDYLEKHQDESLDDLVLSVLESNIHYLNEMGYEIYYKTEEFLYTLIKDRN